MRAGVQVGKSLLAGCAQAANLARFYFCTPIANTLIAHPNTRFQQFIDDMVVRSLGGWLATIWNRTAAIGPLRAELLQQRCMVSAKKINLVWSSRKLEIRLTKDMGQAGLAFPAVTQARDLGVDTSKTEGNKNGDSKET
jgi:hypothetical protein